VARWLRRSLSVVRPFRLSVPHELLRAPFPHPAHRTGRADFSHPALGQGTVRSPTGGPTPRRLPLRLGTQCTRAAPEPEWGFRHTPMSRSFAAFCTALELRPLPSTGITRLPRYYGPLRHPTRPSLTLTGCRLEAVTLHRVGLPVLHPVSWACMPSPLPRRTRWELRSTFPATTAFPESLAGRRPHCRFRGLLSVHSRYGLPARRVALGDPFHRRLRLLRCLRSRSDCYWLERQLPGGIGSR
jgi:hypothetical protein